MRIFFILEYYHPHTGGVETLFKSLAESLDSKGHQVTILTNQFDTKLSQSESFGQNGLIIRKNYHNRYWFTFTAWWAAIKLAQKADLIHTTSFNAAVPAWIASTVSGKKAVITFHEYWGKLWFELPWMSYPSRVLHRLFERIVGGMKFNRFIAVSEATASSLRKAGINEERISTIHNGIEYDEFPKHKRTDARKPFHFLFFGRVGYSKGLDLLLPAYAKCNETLNDHHLELIIPSEDHSLLRKVLGVIEDLQLTSRVTLTHDLPRKELLQKIASSDAVIIPSYSEGFCYAAAETMAIGTPIISSGRKALKEVVSGRFIEVDEFSVDGFSKAMIDALNDRWSETPLKRFHLSDTIRKYEELYQELLG